MKAIIIIASIYGAIITAGAVCVIVAHRKFRRLLAQAKAEREALNKSRNPLEELMQQERIKQAVPLVTLVAMNLPVDVVSVTLITHYADGCSLALDCGKPERIEAPKEF